MGPFAQAPGVLGVLAVAAVFVAVVLRDLLSRRRRHEPSPVRLSPLPEAPLALDLAALTLRPNGETFDDEVAASGHYSEGA